MKRLLTILTSVSLSFAFLSCTGEDNPTTDNSITLSINPPALVFGGDASSQEITVSTNAKEWTAEIPATVSWVSLSPVSGNGDASVKVSVGGNGNAMRSTTISFSAKGAKTKLLTISQEPGNGETPPIGTSGLYADPEIPDADAACTLYYKAGSSSPFYGFSGDLYAHIGIVETEWAFVQAEWNVNLDKCKWKKTGEDNLWKLEIAPDIRQWFGSGETPVSKIGVVVRNADGTKQTADLFVKVQDNKYRFEPTDPVKEATPSGCHHGINYNSDGSVTLVLYDKDKNGKSHDYCYVIGEFNGWKRIDEYAMKRDDSAGCWWYTFSGIDPDKEYMFQYYAGFKNGDAVKLHDPYTETVYDGYNDKYIPSSTYPDLPSYPEGTSGLVSSFKVNRSSYSWSVPDYTISDPDDLIIYEIHFRDFTSSGDINGALEKLDYLKTLGVNAVEVMPIQEFEGNDSWGYNPCSYFALDKAYGTKENYKMFVDACHTAGMAVIVDVVYNQATGAHPYAKLYWNSTANKTAANNPWFNVDAPHPYSVFHDWNHEFNLTRTHVKESLKYLIEEYNIDGFRFDLTKGFTNKSSTESTASNYDQSRIDILKDYNTAIREVKKDAVVILEHFCAQDEEKALAQAGMKVWRNMNNAYCQTAMGFSSDSDFSGLWTGSAMPFGSYVGFMESHDEERTAYKSKTYGSTSIKGSVAARMQREALNAAFFLTVPGPKMLWQFQELGYDISIEENGRTGKKPLHWEYFDVAERKALYDTYSGLLKFRKENPEFFRSDASFSWKVGTSNWSGGRTITCTAGSKSFVVVGNFDTSEHSISVSLPSEGNWKNYNAPAETFSGNSATLTLPSGGWALLVNF
ncbi:MAG: alpha-amylase family glycosyl hydrolase [Candidatus Cryptobacteroides sp.]